MRTSERCTFDLENRDNETVMPVLITADELYFIYGSGTLARCRKYAPQLNADMFKYGITTRNRIAAFVATIGVESARLQYVEEVASGKAYEGRKDLGNTQAGDGVRFKGRGLMQITGRANYRAVSDAFGVDFIADPARLEKMPYCVSSACWWWDRHECNEYADEKNWRQIRKIVNGGYNGYADYLSMLEKALKILER